MGSTLIQLHTSDRIWVTSNFQDQSSSTPPVRFYRFPPQHPVPFQPNAHWLHITGYRHVPPDRRRLERLLRDQAEHGDARRRAHSGAGQRRADRARSRVARESAARSRTAWRPSQPIDRASGANPAATASRWSAGATRRGEGSSASSSGAERRAGRRGARAARPVGSPASPARELTLRRSRVGNDFLLSFGIAFHCAPSADLRVK